MSGCNTLLINVTNVLLGSLLLVGAPSLACAEPTRAPKLAAKIPVKKPFSYLNALQFSPDSRLLTASSMEEVFVWDVATRKLLATLKVPKGQSFEGASCTRDSKRLMISRVSWSIQGDKLVPSNKFSGKEFDIWDFSRGKVRTVLQDHRDYVNSCIASPDESMLASIDDAGVIILSDFGTGNRIRSIGGEKIKGLYQMLFLSDGKVLAVYGSTGPVKLWDAATGKALGRLGDETTMRLSSLVRVSSEDGKTLAIGGGNYSWPFGRGIIGGPVPGELQLWDVRTLRRVRTFAHYPDYVAYVAFSPDGKTFAAGSSGSPIELRNTDSGKLLSSKKSGIGYLRWVAFSPNNAILVVVGSAEPPVDGLLLGPEVIAFWKADGREELHRINTSRHGMISTMAFSPDGKYLAMGGFQPTIDLWKIPSPKGTGSKGPSNKAAIPNEIPRPGLESK